MTPLDDDWRKRIEQLTEENEELRRAADSFGRLAERLNEQLREERRQGERRRETRDTADRRKSLTPAHPPSD